MSCSGPFHRFVSGSWQNYSGLDPEKKIHIGSLRNQIYWYKLLFKKTQIFNLIKIFWFVWKSIPASHLLFFRGKLYWGLDTDPYNFLRDPGPGKSYGSCGTASLLLNERICILKDTGCNRVPNWEICKLRERALGLQETLGDWESTAVNFYGFTLNHCLKIPFIYLRCGDGPVFLQMNSKT